MCVNHNRDLLLSTTNLNKHIARKRANQNRAEWIEIVRGELFFLRKEGKQKVEIADPKEQNHILEAS